MTVMTVRITVFQLNSALYTTLHHRRVVKKYKVDTELADKTEVEFAEGLDMWLPLPTFSFLSIAF